MNGWEGLGGNRREGIGGTDWEGGNQREWEELGCFGLGVEKVHWGLLGNDPKSLKIKQICLSLLHLDVNSNCLF